MKKLPVRKIALTDRSLKALKADKDGTRQTVWDAMMPGLAVRVSALGKRSFYAVKRRAGNTTPTWVLLGVYPVMTLGEAREAARQALTALIAGQHPKTLAEEKRRAAEAAARDAEANTFAAVANAFARQYLPRIKSAKLYESYLKRELIPVLGARPVAGVRRKDIIVLLDGVRERSGPATARQTLSVLRKLLNWGMSRDLLETNPAARINVDDVIGKAEARDRLLSDAELAAIWPAIDAVGAPFATIYKILLLTGARLREIADAKWEHLDLDAATLTVPAERSKTGDALLIPLPPAAVELFRAVPRFTGPYVFSTTAGRAPVQTFSRAKTKLDAAIAAPIPAFVTHDFRRAVRSGLGRLGVPAVVAELCLGHKQPGIVGVYDRHSYFDEKRDALRKWQDHLMAIVEPPPAEPNKVVPMRQRAMA
ncbi:MAG TPA: tyrosine-type recombinase/integrase [Stellaceae bacterium]|nr:tyrosine-type recombinase/integrase [Stellaceae bacterium]